MNVLYVKLKTSCGKRDAVRLSSDDTVSRTVQLLLGFTVTVRNVLVHTSFVSLEYFVFFMEGGSSFFPTRHVRAYILRTTKAQVYTYNR